MPLYKRPLEFEIPDSGVTPGVYGDATHVGQITVGADGRITDAAEVVISGVTVLTVTTLTDATDLEVGDSGKAYDNTGATGIVPVTLPAAEAGLVFEFHVTDTDGFQILPDGTDVIYVGLDVTDPGNPDVISSTTVGSVLRLLGHDDGTWTSIASGTWVIDVLPVVITTVLTRNNDTPDNGWGGYTTIHIFQGTSGGGPTLLPATGQWARITIQMSLLGVGSTLECWFGQNDGVATDNDYDFSSAPVNVPFSGLGVITGDGVTLEYVSDWFELTEPFDYTKIYLFAVNHVGSTGTLSYTNATSGMYFKSGAGAATPDKSGYFVQSLAGPVHLIEIATGEP